MNCPNDGSEMGYLVTRKGIPKHVCRECGLEIIVADEINAHGGDKQ